MTQNSNIAHGSNSSKNNLRRSTRIKERTRTDGVSETEHEKPLFTMGVVADIQYAPIPDGFSFSGTPRYYRHALKVAQVAAQHFQDQKVDLMVNLGDLVDGYCQTVTNVEQLYNNVEKATSDDNDHDNNVVQSVNGSKNDNVDIGLACCRQVLDALSVYKSGPVFHSYGNHCLYNMDRETMQRVLKIPFVRESCGDLAGYYSHLVDSKDGGAKIRLVFLDSYDIAVLRRCDRSSQKRKQAAEMLAKYNRNYPQAENSPEGLVGLKRRFVAFNGGVGPRQLEWLQDTLDHAKKNDEKCLIFSHQPIHPKSTAPVCLMWNYDEVLTILRNNSEVVLASLAGHAHSGGYHCDAQSGIHFRVIEAVLESPPPFTTYATIDVYSNRIKINGFGDCESATYKRKFAPTNKSSRTTTEKSVEESKR